MITTSGGVLRISRSARGANELQLVDGEAFLIDPLGRMALAVAQVVIFDE